jgi:outer membrane lipoprotein SlyB
MRWLPKLSIVFILAVPGCASQRPVLYPNEQLKRVGMEAANRDIDDCLGRAENYVPSSGRAGKAVARAATDAATSATVGAAAGAAGGSIVGQAGTGAAIGGASSAAGGATRGLVRGLFSKPEPSPVQKNLVNRCLREKGYSPVGWE